MEIKINSRKFEVDPSSHKNYWEFISSGNWEKESFKVLELFLKPGNVFIDIGAWAGPLSLYASSMACKVEAIEPDPEIFPDLEQNVLINKSLPGQIKTHNCAIDIKSGTRPLNARFKYGQSSSSLLNRAKDQLSSSQVNCLSIDDFKTQKKIDQIDFIKLDVEGAEFHFLNSWKSSETLKGLPTLMVSFHVDLYEEALFRKNFRNRGIALFALKLNRLFKLNVAKKWILEAWKHSILGLEKYPYIYSMNQQSVKSFDLLNQPKIYGNSSIIFSKWEL